MKKDLVVVENCGMVVSGDLIPFQNLNVLVNKESLAEFYQLYGDAFVRELAKQVGEAVIEKLGYNINHKFNLNVI